MSHDQLLFIIKAFLKCQSQINRLKCDLSCYANFTVAVLPHPVGMLSTIEGQRPCTLEWGTPRTLSSVLMLS